LQRNCGPYPASAATPRRRLPASRFMNRSPWSTATWSACCSAFRRSGSLAKSYGKPRTPSCLTCPVVAFCATRGELPAGIKPLPQKKKDIHYALHLCNSEHEPSAQESGRPREVRDGRVFLVQREPKASLMPGMWELPESSGASRVGGP